MVARVGGYYGSPFHGQRGVTQGDPLSPTIFNAVVDAVVCHWEYLVVEQEGEIAVVMKYTWHKRRGGQSGDRYNSQRREEEGHQRLTVKSAFLYANYWMVASTDPGWLQQVFETLTGLFDRGGLQTNIRNTVWMVCSP